MAHPLRDRAVKIAQPYRAPPVGKPNAMGIHEIALRLGVSKSRARQLVAGKNFPDGVRLHQGWIWSVEDVEAWIAAHRPPPPDGES